MNPWTLVALANTLGQRIVVPAFAVNLALRTGWQPANA
jgi:hypothetical protein